MQTAYIYSASRVNALTQFLLTRTEIERLLVAAPGTELQSALKETYLAPYIVRVPSESVAEAIEQTLIDAKRLIHRIAPQGDMFRVLWVQYDIHNLRVFAKTQVRGVALELCRSQLSARGIYDPQYLAEQVESRNLNALQSGWQEAYDAALQAAERSGVRAIDQIFDQLYFTTSTRIALSAHDPFIHRYLATYIDLYNLKVRIRQLRHAAVVERTPFIPGGTFGADTIETIEQVFMQLARFGGESFWAAAISHYQTTGHTTRLDARADEYLVHIAKEASYDMFSAGSLVLYYLLCRQAAANVRTIVVGRENGQSEVDIRANLRLAYVNE